MEHGHDGSGAVPGGARPTAGPVALLVAAAAFAGLDVLLHLAGERTVGALGPAAGLGLTLLVDLSLPLVTRFPGAVAGITLLVSACTVVGDLVAPGLVTPPVSLTPGVLPTATPAVVWFLFHLWRRRDALLFTALLAVPAVRPWAPGWTEVYAGLMPTVLPAVLALYFRARRELVASLLDRAASAEREKHLLAERATLDERRRLASEMHDIVTHHVTEIVLHAGALQVSAPDGDVREAAGQIREAGTRTLTELRGLFGVLDTGQVAGRPDGEGERGRGRDTVPPEDVAELVEAARASGDAVTLEVRGEPGPLSRAVARTVYRVVQESVTNARKHAPGAAVRVGTDHRRGTVAVTVENGRPTGPGDAALVAGGSGAGLEGLRRRVSLLGGTFDAGPVAGGGFRVTAELPAVDGGPGTAGGKGART